MAAAVAAAPAKNLTQKAKEKNIFQLFGEAFVKGDIFTKLSFPVWGLGFLARGQRMKALLVTFVEAFGLYFIAVVGAPNLAKFGTLGTVQMEMVFDMVSMKNVVNDYDNSFSILLLSVISLFIIAAMLFASMGVVCASYDIEKRAKAGKKPNNFIQDARSYLNEKFYVTLLTLPVLGVIVFTIIPLFILIGVAFTNYDQQHMPPSALFTWVGFTNFISLFSNGLTATFGYSFRKVLAWTLVWAFFATFTTYIGGVLVAMFINDKKTKCKKLWRTLLMVTIAVPQFVTLLLVRNFFSDTGIMNTICANIGLTGLLQKMGLLGSLTYIPFLSSSGWAKFTIIMINIWIGVPYQMLIATGVLMNIPSDMLEAATIDGASPVQRFRHITVPYLLAVTGPTLVTDFVKNINNFNVIYLLTQDVFYTHDQALANSNAKEIDLLVTWLFRLTQDYYNYKMASVIGIMVFIVCAVFTVVCFKYINSREATFA